MGCYEIAARRADDRLPLKRRLAEDVLAPEIDCEKYCEGGKYSDLFEENPAFCQPTCLDVGAPCDLPQAGTIDSIGRRLALKSVDCCDGLSCTELRKPVRRLDIADPTVGECRRASIGI